MIHRLLDDIKIAAGLAARQTFFVGAVALSLFVTTAFLCAAAFIFVFERYGPVQACLTGAAIFFIVTVLSAGSYVALKSKSNDRPVAPSKPATAGFTSDPMMLAAGLQIVRAIGIKRLLPILAVAGIAFGVLATRNQSSPDDDESADT